MPRCGPFGPVAATPGRMRLSVKKLSALALLALLAVVAAVACGSDSEDVGNGAPTPSGDDATLGPQLLDQPDSAQVLSTQVTRPANEVVDIVVSGALFQQNNIAVSIGESVLIRVTNSDLFAHNLRIAGLDGEFDTQDDAVTEPDTLGGGDAGELMFAPPVAGRYTFRCDFHPASMGGVIVVE